jgi:hypothetical protein
MGCTCGTDRAAGIAAGIAATTPAVLAAATEPLATPFPVPAYPPAEWFTEKPEWLTPETGLSVDDEGRVAGYFFHHGQCLVHDASACPRPSPTGYAAFHQSEVITASGEPINVGVIGDVGGHADPYATAAAALAHYSDPAKQLVIARAYDDDIGGVILGSVVPETGKPRRPVNYGDVALLRRSATSGDWRPMAPQWWEAFGIRQAAVRECEGFDCIGPTLVNRGALPLVRRFTQGARAAAVLGGLGGVQLDDEELPTMADNATVIDVPGGVKVTVPGVAPPAGPHPAGASALLAAPPPAAGNGAGETETPDDANAEEQRLGDLEQRVADLEDVVRKIVDVIGGDPAQVPGPAGTPKA